MLISTIVDTLAARCSSALALTPIAAAEDRLERSYVSTVFAPKRASVSFGPFMLVRQPLIGAVLRRARTHVARHWFAPLAEASIYSR